MFIEALFTIAKIWKQPKCPSVDESIKKICVYVCVHACVYVCVYMYAYLYIEWNIQFSSVPQSYLTLCDPMDCSTPGLPVHHQFLVFTQTHVHRVGDAIQPSHPLSSPSPAFNTSQHQSLFK